MKKFLIRKIKIGMLFIIPLVFAGWVVNAVVSFMDKSAGYFLPEELHKTLSGIWGFGLIMALLLMFIVGLIFDGKLQQRFYTWLSDKTINRIPGFGIIHSSTKQIMEALTSEESPFKKPAFARSWSGPNSKEIVFDLGPTWMIPNQNGEMFLGPDGEFYPVPEDGYHVVFVPQAINLSNGYVRFEKKEDLQYVPHLGVEQLTATLISCGLTLPKKPDDALGKVLKNEEQMQQALKDWRANAPSAEKPQHKRKHAKHEKIAEQ
ncbi:DUF502 domain-containing protein [Vibrio gangliei]|uniref:DUF502 domain-containing protein n=1 Tax=Vibrio gangliei TaxID=2077090 RepID=UPI000D01BAD8|nr:DUF502 domain-containing protein [Vibrio gangliei]